MQLAWLRRLIAGDGLLAHWQFAGEDWQTIVAQDFRFSRRQNLSRLLIMGLMIVMVGGGFALFAPDRGAGGVVALIMLGLLIVLALVAMLLPAWTHRRLSRAQPVVWIGAEGVCVGNQAQRWSGFGSRLESVQLDHREGAMAQLAVRYSMVRTMTGPVGLQRFRDEHTVLVPVPPGRESEAEAIAQRLSKR